MPFIITIPEVLDMIVMTLAAGFIFKDSFKRPGSQDPVEALRESRDWKKKMLYSAGLVAPALILHELGHKFVALAYGYSATFYAAYGWLAAGVVLKLISFPFLIIVPAFVRILGESIPLTTHSLIAFAGPGVNLVLFLIAYIVVKKKKMSLGALQFWQYTKIINGFLFVFNMLPIPGFDGSKVYPGLFSLFF